MGHTPAPPLAGGAPPRQGSPDTDKGLSMRLPRLLLLTALTAVGSLFAVSSADAGLLVRTVGPCDGRATSRVFLPWLDPLNYTLVSGGTFEGATAGWTGTGAAQVVAGSETYYVAGANHVRSLSLPPGSSATTPSTCVGLDRPVLRLFARNTGSALSTLRVDVLFEDASGTVRSLPAGVLVAGRNWNATLPVPVVVNLLPLLPGQGTPVAFRFTPLGVGGGWAIDDVYVDPRRSR
jgi:hypothetical protein